MENGRRLGGGKSSLYRGKAKVPCSGRVQKGLRGGGGTIISYRKPLKDRLSVFRYKRGGGGLPYHWEI